MSHPLMRSSAAWPDRWVHLLHLAEELEVRSRAGTLSATDLQVFLGSVDETFAEGSDPLEDFAAFALRRFCRQLSASLGALR